MNGTGGESADRGGQSKPPSSHRWADLSRRIASTLVLLGIGVLLAFATGIWLRLGMAVISAVTFWELASMTGWKGPRRDPGPFGSWRPIALACIAGFAQASALMFENVWTWMLLILPIIAGIPGAERRDRGTYAIFGMAILLVAYALVWFREEYGLHFVLWLMGIVIISDTAGYFVGRVIGGPKFWPSLSPKKTWSGTAAGWVGALIFGIILYVSGAGDVALIWCSPLVAFAGQMGDIAESWLKRRAGVKDSSNLIPGHGGFMDRFDAVTGAVLATILIGLVTALPVVN